MKKNVAILIHQLANGGAERVASNLSLYLSDDKYNKFIIINNDERLEYPYQGQLINLGTKVKSNIIGKFLKIL